MNRFMIVFAVVALVLSATTQAKADSFNYDGTGTSLVDSIVWNVYGSDNHPSFVFVFGSGGSIKTYTDPNTGPYDGVEDTYVGVVNQSGATLTKFNLAAPSANGIFGFESDGIDSYGSPGNSTDTTGYGGPLGWFSNLSSNNGTDSGTVNLTGGGAAGLASNATSNPAGGGFTWFSLEGPPNPQNTIPSTTPEPSSLVLLGFGLSSLSVYGWRRRKVAAK
jgi:hypothetical protein